VLLHAATGHVELGGVQRSRHFVERLAPLVRRAQVVERDRVQARASRGNAMKNRRASAATWPDERPSRIASKATLSAMSCDT
jgi:hypothetical protein